jgi:restriction endonuclease S subunit/predicted nucleotidyltransferase component of viral defense system
VSAGPDRAESIRQRLRNVLRRPGEDAQFGLQRYAAERFLYRLGKSSHRERFVLKGAALFALWGGAVYRATRDLDFTDLGSPDANRLLTTLSEICEVPSPGDGLTFDPRTLSTEPIRDDSDYNGLRVRLEARLGESRIPVQIDIGFGNAIVPAPTLVSYPTLLGDPAPRILAYPLEAVIAEKLHAMVLLGERNTRFKDFYDLYVLAGQFEFDGGNLTAAIAATFARRRTAADGPLPASLAPGFFAEEARAAQWRAYLNRNGLPGAPASFDDVGEALIAFIGPPWASLSDPRAFTSRWRPGGSWETEHGVPPNDAAGVQAGRTGVGAETGPAELPAAARRLKPYAVYKDSGVEWLGEIPAHWEVKRLKLIAPMLISKLDSKPADAVYVGLENVESWTGRFLLDHQQENVDSVVASFEPGDVLFGKLRPYLAKVARPDFAGVCTSEIVALRPAASCAQSYLMYCLLNARYIGWLDSLTYGTKMPRVSPEQIAASFLPLPGLDEQHAIAAFLDRETARIDALVAKKERLIELLQEKRTALITRALTKGLEPNGTLVDTGSVVFPRIPEHWELRKLRRIIRRVRRPVLVDPDTEYREIGIRSWGKGLFHKPPVRGALLEEKSVFSIEPKDFVLNIVFAWEGAVGVVTTNELGMVASHRFPTFRCTSDIDLDYLLMVLQTDQGRAVMEVNSPGAAGRNRTIRLDQFLNEEIPVALLLEQRAIVARFRSDEQRIEAFIAKVREAIERLRELRTALISAAVTGRVDVRG